MAVNAAASPMAARFRPSGVAAPAAARCAIRRERRGGCSMRGGSFSSVAVLFLHDVVGRTHHQRHSGSDKLALGCGRAGCGHARSSLRMATICLCICRQLPSTEQQVQASQECGRLVRQRELGRVVGREVVAIARVRSCVGLAESRADRARRRESVDNRLDRIDPLADRGSRS